MFRIRPHEVMNLNCHHIIFYFILIFYKFLFVPFVYLTLGVLIRLCIVLIFEFNQGFNEFEFLKFVDGRFFLFSISPDKQLVYFGPFFLYF